MKTRATKTMGVTAGIAAIAMSVPLAINAYAEPPAEPTPSPSASSTVEQPIPDLQGPGCDDAVKKPVPNWKAFDRQPVGAVLSGIPDISTFNSAVTGGLNPTVNILPVLENGPYVVFAPTNEAFAKLPPEQLEALKADPAALSKLVYYHVFLGLLGPDDVKGQRPTQEGSEIKVTGKGGDIKVNDTAKLVCGAVQGTSSRVYLIDTVLDPNSPPDALTPSVSSSTSETTTTTTTTSSPAPEPAADAPVG